MKTQPILSIIVFFAIPLLSSAQELNPAPDDPKLLKEVEAEKELEWKILANPADLSVEKDVDEFIEIIANAEDITDGVRKEEVQVMKKLQSLLKLKPEKLTTKDLLGLKRVRSIQISGLGVFSYPYFNCRFKNTDKQTFFEKTTGSQRKSGLIFPNTESTLVFLGASTVNEEGQRQYSGITKSIDKEHDQVGVFIKRGKSILAIFPKKGSRYEVYEFK